MTRGQALAVLGLDNRATLRTIKKAYRKMALLTHPDKGGDIEKFKVAANAYGFLTGKGQVTRPRIARARVPVQWVYVHGCCYTGNASVGTTGTATTGGVWY